MELDGFLTRLYWDTLDKNLELKSLEERFSIGYWEWESGKEKGFPKSTAIWEILTKEKYFGSFNNQYNLKADFENQSQFLHKYIHGRPPSRHNPGNTRSSNINIKFEKSEFDDWLMLFTTTYDLMTIMSLLLYRVYLKRPSWSEFIMLNPERLNQIHLIIDSTD